MLTAIPDGAQCYLDATMFYYHLVETPALSDDCSDLLKQIELGRVFGVTSTVALAEATHKVMLAEVVARHGVRHQGLIARLKRHPALLDGLTSHHRVLETVIWGMVPGGWVSKKASKNLCRYIPSVCCCSTTRRQTPTTSMQIAHQGRRGMLLGYMRVSKADGAQVLDLQRDALLAAGVTPDRLYEDLTSGQQEARPGLEACLKALRAEQYFGHFLTRERMFSGAIFPRKRPASAR